MIEYKPNQGSEEVFENSRPIGAQNEEKLSLTQLWEVIVRTKRLPDGSDVNILYAGVRDKLRDPEREVRQHALRVLIDLIPVTQVPSLDDHMRALLPELLSNLGHPAPALRKGALDTLRIYLSHSRNRDQLLRDLISSTPAEDNLLAAAPFLVDSATSDETLTRVLERLGGEIREQGYRQEVAAKSLARLRYTLGDERFRMLFGRERFAELQKVCDLYGFPIDYSDGDVSDGENVIWTEDKVILETEITLRTGPAITMKIHEESRSGSREEEAESEDEASQKMGVIKVLEDDSDPDFYEAARTPRKVRFGGESVKMRTPESDSNHEDSESTIRITVTDAVSIKTRQSLIPVRITSLPSTPRKVSSLVKPRLHKSTPNLSRSSSRSRIPMRKGSNVKKESAVERVSPASSPKSQSNPPESRKASAIPTPPPRRRKSRAEDDLSPIPVHNEIEVIHNLTRSPERKRTRSPTPQIEPKKEESEEQSAFHSFQLRSPASTIPELKRTQNLTPQIEERREESEKQTTAFNSFHLHSPASAISEQKAIRSLTPQIDERLVEGEKQTTAFSNFQLQSPTSAISEQKKIRNLSPQFEESEKQTTAFNSFQLCSPVPEERTPERLKPVASTPQEKDKGQEDISAAYSSFQVCPESCRISKENLSETNKDSDELLEKSINLHQPLEIASFSTEDELSNKSEALDNLIKMLKQPNTCEALEPGPAALLFEALFACQHLDVLHFLADDALALLVGGLRPQILEQCLGHVAQGICKMGTPSGVSLGLKIMKKCPANKLQLEIMDKCFAHRTREGALQILMAAARLLPSNEVEVSKITEFAASALRDRRRRVRHAALETLATLAQLSSNVEVLDTVNKICETSQDRQYLLRVVRTRLSRRQLPIVEMDGKIRYSTPRDQTEVEWLSGITIPSSPPSSAASSSTPSVNYWRHNSRHEGNVAVNLHQQSPQDDSGNGNQQIWAVDSSVFPKTSVPKEAKSNGIKLQPIYILQPEAVRLGDRGHRRYDRGRSFSPPKPARGPFQDVSGTGATPHNENLASAQRNFKFTEGFRKSFSSEQLYCTERPQHHEPYSFSLSSRSSTTSTGSSTRSGVWQKDMRSGIPVPISSETKLRIRTTTTSTSVNVGPVIARRSALGSPVHNIDSRLSPRQNGRTIHAPQPPPSSGSESSGYFTPPPETQQAFVKLDTEEHASESEEIVRENDDNNNSQDCTDSFNNNSPNIFLRQDTVQRNFSPSFVETSDHIDEKETTLEVETLEEQHAESNNNLEREERRLLRFSSSSLKEPSFTGKIPQVTDNRRKSKSVVDLQSFLPDISANRKTVNSAPPLNEDVMGNSNVVITNIDVSPVSPIKTMLPITAEPSESVPKLESPKEEPSTRKLTKRFARTLSRKSMKSTPRSVRETTPRSSRPSSKPKDVLLLALGQLNNNEWEIMIQGLQSLAKLTRQHPETIESQIHTVCVSLGRQIKNLRSQVARTACQTASEIFMTCKRGLDIELEEIAGPLLQRTADTNKFLRADANSALDVMCAHLPTNRVVTVVTSRGCTHQNCIVRSAAIRLINDMVKRFGADRVFQMQKEMKDKIILAGANALTDGSLEARSYGKVMFSHLMGHPQFHRSLLDAVPQSTLRHIAKTLGSIKPQMT